jgi:hypothetical protein
MHVTHVDDPAVAGYAPDRRRAGAPPDRRVAGLRPVIKATGWILAGAGVGTIAIVALLWALTSFTTVRDTSDTWTVVTIDQHPVAR